jgi:hypothetical protein
MKMRRYFPILSLRHERLQANENFIQVLEALDFIHEHIQLPFFDKYAR